MISIETKRLILRPFVDSDAERVLDIHRRLEVIRWISNPPFVPMRDLDEARMWIASWATVREGSQYDAGCAIEVKESGLMVGTVMVVPLPNADAGERQVGWHLHPDSVGHGYATEAARGLLDDVFGRGLEEIWCDMYADNDNSVSVAIRLGLTDLGVLPDPWYGDKSRLFKMTREGWLNQ